MGIFDNIKYGMHNATGGIAGSFTSIGAYFSANSQMMSLRWQLRSYQKMQYVDSAYVVGLLRELYKVKRHLSKYKAKKGKLKLNAIDLDKK